MKHAGYLDKKSIHQKQGIVTDVYALTRSNQRSKCHPAKVAFILQPVEVTLCLQMRIDLKVCMDFLMIEKKFLNRITAKSVDVFAHKVIPKT